MEITKYNDPGHGWYKVPISMLNNLGIANKISGYSYKKGDNAYLEEDCDAGILFDALENNNVTIKIIDKFTNNQSRIRGYDSFLR